MAADIMACSIEELKDYFENIGEKPFRAKQVYAWLHEKLAEHFSEMTNLSAGLQKRLESDYEITQVTIVKHLTSKIDGTQKFLFRLSDGNVIESVLMKYKHGNSVCISTQVGCRMGCRFCASTLEGLVRNLTVSEMLREIYAVQKYCKERISNVVLMGSGEPMDNFDNVISLIHKISDENGLHISQRNITISTCGLIDNMKRLADLGLQVTLALSLHAADDATRKQLMPIANKYTIRQELEACTYYFDKTGRRVTLEYSLVSGVNDQLKEAEKLVRLVRGMHCHVNLIPVNPIKERNYQKSSAGRVAAFQKYLEKNGINATIRREMGSDIQGACGQLRKSFIEDET